MSTDPIDPDGVAAEPKSAQPQRRQGRRGWGPAGRWLNKGNENYLLNLFTVLLVASGLIIMLLVGTAIHSIYSSAMVRNAEVAAVSWVGLIMSAEVDNLITQGPDGQSMIAVNAADIPRLDAQMRRYLKPFSMHKIKLFTPDQKIIYSTDPSLIGQIDKDNKILQGVLQNSKAFSELEHKKAFKELGGGRILDASIVETYAPVLGPNQRVLGVFEVYVDITKTRVEVVKVLALTMTALAAVLSVCLFSLYRPMKRGTLKLISAHRELKELATRDYLTGAYNRRYINDRVKQEFHRMRRQSGTEQINKSISFIMADIDYFKKVNDTYGHGTGDAVLREVSHRLKDALRDYDVLCRYGGEEFLILLPHTNEGDAVMVAERLRQSIVCLPVSAEDGASVAVTVSFGVATSHDGGESEFAVIERADQALYRAKEEGRNRVILAEQPGVLVPPHPVVRSAALKLVTAK